MTRNVPVTSWVSFKKRLLPQRAHLDATRGCNLLVAAVLMVAGSVGSDWCGAPSGAAQAAIVRASVNSNGTQGNSISLNPSLSADGRKVVFESNASNLISGDTNGTTDVFVRDLTTGAITRVSVDASGNQGNSVSRAPRLSADGRKVVFESFSDNLVSGDTNGSVDVFMHDLTTGTITRISMDSNGKQGNSFSNKASLNADGSKVAFVSNSSNLVSGDTNNSFDIFVRDLTAGVTARVSVNSSGVQGNGDSNDPTLSADDSKVAFVSNARNLVSGDTNNLLDVFVVDLTTGVTKRVSVDSSGNQGNGNSGARTLNAPSLSADGSRIAFDSSASNLVSNDTNGEIDDVFVHGLTTGITTLVSVNSNGTQGNGFSDNPSLSADGSKVAFQSFADNLVKDDTGDNNDIFVRNLTTGATTRFSVDSSGVQGDDFSFNASLSADGSKVAFESVASNLVSGDTNGFVDIFVSDEYTVSAPAVSANNDEYTLILGAPDQVQQSGVVLLSSGVFQIQAPGVLRNDGFALGSKLTVRTLNNPRNGRFQLRNDGRFYYLPNAGFVGDEEFIYTISNGQNTSQARVRLSIVDKRAPELCIDTPTNDATLKTVTKIAGRVRDKQSGVRRVSLVLRRSGGEYWNGSQWVAELTSLPVTVEGINWFYTGQLPTNGNDPKLDLTDGRYELKVDASDKSFNSSLLIRRITIQNGPPKPPMASTVRFSSGTAYAAQGIVELRFTGALDDLSIVSSFNNYLVLVNGVAQGFGIGSGQTVYTLNRILLSPLDLKPGDVIDIRFQGLRDAQGNPIPTGNVRLIAR